MLYIPFPFQRCPKCGNFKLPSEFYRKHAWCRICSRRTQRDKYHADPEKARAKAQAEYQRNRQHKLDYQTKYRRENPEKKAVKDRDYRRRNKERLAAQKRKEQIEYPELQRVRNKRWKSAHKSQVNTSTRRRRSLKKQLPATFTADDWTHALAWFDNRCAYCGRPIGFWHTLARDHFYPESKLHGFTPDNIVPACHGEGGCNNSKSDRDPVEWLTEKFGPRKAKQILKRIQEYFDTVRKT